MSSFLVNLARRGAGLPATMIQTPPPSPFGAEIGNHADAVTETHGTADDLAMAEQPTTGNTATQALWRASSSEERVEPSLEASTHPTPAIQRLSGTAPSISTQPSVAEPAATIRTPALGPLPEPRWSGVPHARAAQAAPIEPPEPLGPAVLLYPTEREDVTASEVERDLHTPLSVVYDVEAAGPPVRHASSLPSTSARVIQASGQKQGVALPAATIRPALAESHTVLDFPRVPSHSSPTPSASLPIHVRIGRVEVRTTTASEPTPARPSSSMPVGFDAYYRMRNYRS